MAPPLGLTRGSSSARPSSRSTARPWAAKASLSSITSMSARDRPVSSSTLRVAGTGPMPMMRGSTPAVAMPTTRARALRPWRLAASGLASSRAQAPSLTPEALPAVMLPPWRKGVPSLANCSRVVSPRGCSSCSTSFGGPLRWGISTGTISLARRPLAWAAAARCWLRRAKASWSSREMLNCSATFSAVSGMESMPNWPFISGLTKRQPMVVSKISAWRENALSALPMTKGARDMDSTPPASISPASPQRRARAALPMASRPEPQRRFRVVPGTLSGRPASREDMRATLRLSSPAWLAQP
ncbi:hypothetical protein D9M69_479790 [compost metagenome]